MTTIQENITLVVAGFGLGLSVYNTVQARRDRRPKLKLHVLFGAFTDGSEPGDPKVFFEVGNEWSRTITLTKICIPLSGKRSLTFHPLEGDRQLPVPLGPGSSTRFWFDPNHPEAATVKAGIGRHEKFRMMAGDALGNEYLSNSISFKPAK